ncbi:MAG: hypothetical protein R3C49_21200 [Planctomycetaceae bacterium]
MNTRRAIQQTAEACGANAAIEYIMVPPAYLAFSRMAWRLGVWYQKLFESRWPFLRGHIVCRMTKPGSKNLPESQPAASATSSLPIV